MRFVHLISIVIYTLILLQSCSSNEPETKQPSQAVMAEKSAPTATEAPVASPEPAPPMPDTAIAPKEKATKKRPPNARVGIIENRQYVSGYVSREKVVLQASPTANAPKTSDLKRYETVYIMETKMTDEAGKSYDVPQWYKVQLHNKKEGWVLANSVSVN